MTNKTLSRRDNMLVENERFAIYHRPVRDGIWENQHLEMSRMGLNMYNPLQAKRSWGYKMTPTISELRSSSICYHDNHSNHSSDKKGRKGEGTKGRKENNAYLFTRSLVYSSTDNTTLSTDNTTLSSLRGTKQSRTMKHKRAYNDKGYKLIRAGILDCFATLAMTNSALAMTNQREGRMQYAPTTKNTCRLSIIDCPLVKGLLPASCLAVRNDGAEENAGKIATGINHDNHLNHINHSSDKKGRMGESTKGTSNEYFLVACLPVACCDFSFTLTPSKPLNINKHVLHENK